jgi:DNA repair exonuclease SbcCD ATPase subunit
MNMNFKSVLAFTLVLLAACQSEKNEQLEHKLDSVNQELALTKQAVLDAQEVKALLDSIDASRQVIHTDMGNSSDSQDNADRLNDLNEYVKDINVKMDQMEKSIKYVNTMAASILKLQADIEVRTDKISKLEADAKKTIGKNNSLMLTVQRKDSTLAAFMKTCQQDVVTLQKIMEDVHLKNNTATANLYFQQAETLAAMAPTVPSGTKRKTVQREALEMYKISLSLGKKEAQDKITKLQTVM